MGCCFSSVDDGEKEQLAEHNPADRPQAVNRSAPQPQKRPAFETRPPIAIEYSRNRSHHRFHGSVERSTSPPPPPLRSQSRQEHRRGPERRRADRQVDDRADGNQSSTLWARTNRDRRPVQSARVRPPRTTTDSPDRSLSQTFPPPRLERTHREPTLPKVILSEPTQRDIEIGWATAKPISGAEKTRQINRATALLREMYALEMLAWSMEGVELREKDRPELQRHREKAREIFLEVEDMVSRWREDEGPENAPLSPWSREEGRIIDLIHAVIQEHNTAPQFEGGATKIE